MNVDPGAVLGQESERRNPYASHRTRPGAMAFRFPVGVSAAALIDDFESRGRQAQIVGPHGSGKSTLVAELLGELRRRDIETVLIELHDGQRRLAREVWQSLSSSTTRSPVVIVDGYEQLGFWQRWKLRRACRGGGLLVTVHHDCGLPTLARTSSDPRLALELARSLDPHATRADVLRAFAAHGGNLREVWFALYDLYEAHRLQGHRPDAPSGAP